MDSTTAWSLLTNSKEHRNNCSRIPRNLYTKATADRIQKINCDGATAMVLATLSNQHNSESLNNLGLVSETLAKQVSLFSMEDRIY